MSEYVAVDAKPVNIGGDVVLLGAAIDVKEPRKFREYYFKKAEKFCKENNISKPFNILKSSEVKREVASYDLSNKRRDFFDEIVANPYIDNLHLSIGWYNDGYSPRYSNTTLDSTQLINKHLKPHFEVVTLWQYHKHHSEEKPSYRMPDTAYCDETGGKVTKAWKYCGKEFDMNIIPHGDQTYPAISTADFVVGSLGDYLPDDIRFQDCKGTAQNFLIDKLNPDVFSKFETINEKSEHSDHIVPQLRYPVKNSVHYPHPIVYIYDDLFEENSNLFSMATKVGYKKGGCAKNISQPEFPDSVQEGDYVVYTDDSNGNFVDSIKSSFPHINTNTVSVQDFVEVYRTVSNSGVR